MHLRSGFRHTFMVRRGPLCVRMPNAPQVGGFIPAPNDSAVGTEYSLIIDVRVDFYDPPLVSSFRRTVTAHFSVVSHPPPPPLESALVNILSTYFGPYFRLVVSKYSYFAGRNCYIIDHAFSGE